MKYFLSLSKERPLTHNVRWGALAVLAAVFGGSVAALGELPSWIRNTEAGGEMEAVFFRMMSLPGGPVAFRRPPAETRPALTDRIKAQPHKADFYSLRALEDEQQLDSAAAESDWKAYLDNSSDKTSARLALADFYHRRLRPADEIQTLSSIANASPANVEKLVSPPQQRSWQAFERIFGVIQSQGLSKDVSIAQYRAWIARYPAEPSLYAQFLQFLVAQKEYATAGQLIADYRRQFPNDQIFPVKANAIVEYRQGSVREGLAVYERSFQPLWAPELVKSYFDLLRDTQNLRKFRDDAHAALVANPEDLSATARMFYFYQQEGKTEPAQQVIADFRAHREASKTPWTARELFVCARLLEDIHAYPESARYYFALYNSQGMPDAQEKAVAGLTSLLLTAPETPIRFGSGELSLYRDIATMDQGPGYLNGILSLILNATQPAAQYSEEEQRATPYFHRSRAAELLALLDKNFPNSARRPELHTQLLEFYSNSGESDAVIQGGRDFLANFPSASGRTQVALLMADAYSRKGDAKDEFTIYDSVLRELAAQAQNVPLGLREDSAEAANDVGVNGTNVHDAEGDEGSEGGEEQNPQAVRNIPTRHRASQSFQLGTTASPVSPGGPRSPEYARVLELYLSRLTEMKQIPPALGVLRHEIDRNPDDPGLYERLAVFLDQNQLGAQQEEIYRRAMSRFQDKSWSDKLARFYLRYKRDSEFEQLTRDAVKTFQGSDLEQYFNNVVGGSPALYLKLNRYAYARFPHDPVFVRNLLLAYQSPATRDPVAWESLLRQHWFEDAVLRNRFFEFLSNRGRLESELDAVLQSAPDVASWEKNPAAADFLAYANLWRSHFEESAPVLKSLTERYPAETEIGHTAASVYRSLAYFDPADTAIAAKMEDNLLQASPADPEILARIGDIYADRELFAQAAPYWERIAQVAPGQSGGYLDAATIYWDYYDFENALRLLSKGRERLGNSNLYSYEAGAIYENKRDYPRAIEEYLKCALDGSVDSSAELRLLALARRPKFRDLVDQSTAKIAAPPNPSMTAVNLRVKVLEAQDHKREMEQFLDSVVGGTTSIEQAEDIETLAQQKSLEAVRQHALEKQATLTTDPFTRLQLRYALIRLYEGRKDFVSAQKNVEMLYHENPKIFGVVRSTVDFYWRNKMQPQAISVLGQAARDSYPELAKRFTYEAARKSTDAKKFQQARDMLSGLLQDDPYNGEYLSAVADTYAQAGDDQGLEKFYLEKIAFFRNAPLAADSRKTQIATLRRGLIPALTRLNNYAGAVDQYIELINNFPEDDALVTEAALYALRYQRQRQLVDFYAKTVAQSPKDYRWSMVLARTQTNLENYTDAIDTYAKSIAVRPDRVDLYIARAGLEERLMRFDEAATDYLHIYQLAYKDPQWMEKAAAIRARQGKVKEVVAALQAALIEGRPENANNSFEVARRLEAWGMLEPARSFAEQGIKQAGSELLANAEHHPGARIYVRILTRLRQQDAAFAALQKALAESAGSLPVLKEQLEKQGIAGMTDAQWRENARRSRVEVARTGMVAALQEMGSAVNTYFTPEERITFAEFADAKRSAMSAEDAEKFAIPLAESAVLADQEARWRFERLLQQAAVPNSYANTAPFVDLQRRRGRFAELGSQMEQLAKASSATQRMSPLSAGADAYRSAGDESGELRVLATMFAMHGLDSTRQPRLFQLLLARQPQELLRIGSDWRNSSGESAANYVLAHGSAQLAHAVVQARGQARPVVWNKVYDALVGLYFSEANPSVQHAFISALGDDTIGARLSQPADRTRQLAGNIWFYYGSRYGEYLGKTKLGVPEEFLPAVLEESPASAAGYLALAEYYAGVGDTKRAIADYDHTLELSPDQPDVYASLAVAYFKQGDRAAALVQWRQALAVLSKQLDSARVPETFWADFGRTCDQLSTRHLFGDAKPAVDVLLRTYLRRNGNYRSNAMLHTAYVAAGEPTAGTVWLLDLASTTHDPATILADVVEASWVPLPQRAAIYQRILESKESASGKLVGLERESAQQELTSWQVRWLQYLVRTKQYSAAASGLAALPKDTRDSQAATLVPLDLQIAAELGTLDTKLTSYRTEPQSAPASEVLRAAARQLFAAGDKQSARKILEQVFAREIEDHKLVAANFLGLAEIRLASGDMAGALDLLHRLVVTVGNPFENLDSAAALLEKTGHNAEAIEFLGDLVKSVPWDASYRLRLAQAKLAGGKDAAPVVEALAAIGSTANVSYDLRLQAAQALVGHSHPDLGSGELNLVSGGAVASTAADKFYFYAARIQAAKSMSDPRMKLQLLSHCIVDFPRRDDARVPLFQAAVDSQSYEFALGAMEPLLQTQFLLNSAPDAAVANYAEEELIVDSTEAESGNDATGSPAAAQGLSRAEQARVAQRIGDTMSHVNRLSDAVSYYQTARRLETPAVARKALLHKIADVKATLRTQHQNAGRQPLLHEALEQDRVVRPQLLAHTMPAGRVATATGVKR